MAPTRIFTFDTDCQPAVKHAAARVDKEAGDLRGQETT